MFFASSLDGLAPDLACFILSLQLNHLIEPTYPVYPWLIAEKMNLMNQGVEY